MTKLHVLLEALYQQRKRAEAAATWLREVRFPLREGLEFENPRGVAKLAERLRPRKLQQTAAELEEERYHLELELAELERKRVDREREAAELRHARDAHEPTPTVDPALSREDEEFERRLGELASPPLKGEEFERGLAELTAPPRKEHDPHSVEALWELASPALERDPVDPADQHLAERLVTEQPDLFGLLDFAMIVKKRRDRGYRQPTPRELLDALARTKVERALDALDHPALRVLVHLCLRELPELARLRQAERDRSDKISASKEPHSDSEVIKKLLEIHMSNRAEKLSNFQYDYLLSQRLGMTQSGARDARKRAMQVFMPDGRDE